MASQNEAGDPEAGDPPTAPDRMTPVELRASAWLAWLYAVRMFGMFLVLPVFAVHARTLPGGESATLIGFALGVYGLSQALLQIPFGIASDRWGRKPDIAAGLVLMAIGSLVAAAADTVAGLAVGRALQGAGAVAAAISALVADSTRDSQRSKAMAMIGASIGIVYALSIVIAPVFYGVAGLSGIFILTAVLSLTAIAILWWRVPDPPAIAAPALGSRASLRLLRDPDLVRLNVGIFVLHLVQMAIFVIVPLQLVRYLSLPLGEHWKVYLPVVVLGFLIMLPPLNRAERKAQVRPVFLAAVGLLAACLLGFAVIPPGPVALLALLLLFFICFNLLEALLPSLVSRMAPVEARGLALGVYSTTQALGLFAGGALGGYAQQRLGDAAVFAVGAALVALWWWLARGARRWPGRGGVVAPAAAVDPA